jgi:hypothetical protein
VLDTGQLSFAQSVTPRQAALIDAGVAFQQKVEAVAVPLVVDVADPPTLFDAEDRTIYLSAVPPLENRKLGLRGLPTACGPRAALWFRSRRSPSGRAGHRPARARLLLDAP